jgi:histidinol-phosphate aminotransferase
MKQAISQLAIHGGKMWQLADHRSDEFSQVINADVNNAFYPPSPLVTAAIQAHLTAINHLPDTSCRLLKRKLASFYHVDQSRIEIGNGSSDLLQTIITGFLRPGDEMVTLSPTYGEYERCARSVGADTKAVALQERDFFAPSVNAILEGINESTRMVVICNPNNPTGQVLKKGDLLSLLRIIDPRIWVLIDEAYIDFSPTNSLIADTDEWRNLIVVRTFSKAYALAGLRIGYAILGDNAAQVFRNLIRPPWPIGLLSLKAAEAALDDREYVDRMLAVTRESTRKLVRDLNRIRGIKLLHSETNFSLANIEGTGIKATELVNLLEEQRILVRNCSSFGEALQNRLIRITAQSDIDNRRIINGLKAVIR